MKTDQKQVWNILSDSWTNLRVRPDEEAIDFSKTIDKGIILDLGCGNCRNLIPFLEKRLKCVGLDFSSSMIREAKAFLKKRGFHINLVIGDVTELPFKGNRFSSILCLRTLHHVETKPGRLKALKEMKRVGNEFIITVWKKWEKRFIWKLIKNLLSSDVYVEWNYHGKIYKRFYHLYTKKELENDLKTAGLKIKRIWENKGRTCAEAES